jgi:hypothetical protein
MVAVAVGLLLVGCGGSSSGLSSEAESGLTDAGPSDAGPTTTVERADTGSTALAANAPAWNSPLAAVLEGTLKPSAGEYRAPFRSSATLWAAKNEFEILHLVLFGPSSGVRITLPGGTAPDGNVLALLTRIGSADTIPGSEVRIYEEQPIVFTQPSSIEGTAGAWPDALVPYGPQTEVGLRKRSDGTWEEVQTTETRRDFPVSVERNTTRSFLVEIHVPLGTPGGLYRGQLTISATGPSISTQVIPIDLHVRSFGLRSTSALQSNVKMEVDAICKAHGDTGSGGWGAWCADPEARHRWTRLYGRVLLDHRITSFLADTLLTRADGSPDYAATELEFRRTYGPLMDGWDPYSRLVGAHMTTVAYPWFQASWSQAHDSADVATAKLREWARFTRGILDWWPRTIFFTLDEPYWHANGYAIATQWASWAHSADPDYRVVLTGTLPEYIEGTGSVASGVANVIASCMEGIDNRNSWMHGNQRPIYDAFVSVNARNEIWAYQSCGIHGCDTNSDASIYGYPLITVDSTAVQNRAQPWMHYIYRLSGLHYWNSVYQLYKAWDVDGAVFTTGNGDGNLLYPGTPTPVSGGSSRAIGGTTHIPLASTRLKILRDGLEDYEYLRSCEWVGGPAMGLARALFPMTHEDGAGPANETGSLYSATSWSPNTWSDDPTVLAAALADRREDLARCIGGASDAAPVPFAALATRQVGTSDAEDSALVAVGDDGSGYLAGATSGAVTGASAGGQDVALWTLDANAVARPWTQFGSAGNDVPRAVLPSHTQRGDVYVAGTTTGVLGSQSLGGQDGFLVRLDSGGNRVWTRQFGTPAADEVAGATIDAYGSIWVVYRTPSWGTSTLLKFSPTGAQHGEIWMGDLPWPIVANAIVSDPWGEVYVGGTSGPDGTGAFVASYFNSGKRAWTIPDEARRVPAPFFGAVTALAFGPDWGLHAGGVNIDLASRNTRPALARLDPWIGIRYWTTTVGGTADQATVTALTSAGSSLYLAGHQQTQVVGQAAKGKDAFVIQFDTAGMRGGSSTVRTSGDEVFTSAVRWGSTGDLLLGGTTTGNVAGSLGAQDLIIQVLRPPG